MNEIFQQMNKKDKKEKTFRVDHPSTIWKKINSPFQLANFLNNQDRIYDVMSLLNPKKPKGMKKVRIGEQNDGGYVFIEDLLKGGKVAYSIGIGKTVKFEEAIEAYGHHIWMYDHTVDGSRFATPNRTIQKIGIGEMFGVSYVPQVSVRQLLVNGVSSEIFRESYSSIQHKFQFFPL